MANKRTIDEMYVECFMNTPIGTELRRKDIVDELQAVFDIDEGSILPSDISYNSSNKGVLI